MNMYIIFGVQNLKGWNRFGNLGLGWKMIFG
jgi:hypothetical protein